MPLYYNVWLCVTVDEPLFHCMTIFNFFQSWLCLILRTYAQILCLSEPNFRGNSGGSYKALIWLKFFLWAYPIILNGKIICFWVQNICTIRVVQKKFPNKNNIVSSQKKIQPNQSFLRPPQFPPKFGCDPFKGEKKLFRLWGSWYSNQLVSAWGPLVPDFIYFYAIWGCLIFKVIFHINKGKIVLQ